MPERAHEEQSAWEAGKGTAWWHEVGRAADQIFKMPIAQRETALGSLAAMERHVVEQLLRERTPDAPHRS